nr:reverse transcriptase domain-containing protein [Tanacetum cinerariifolium]
MPYKANILNFCEEHYEDIFSVIMDKIHRDKRKEVHARLDLGENLRSQRVREGSQNSSAGTLPARYRNPSERPNMRDRLEYNDEDVFDQLSHRSRGRSRIWGSSSKDHPRNKNRPCGIEESYGAARVWFNELPLEIIDGYKGLKVAFLAYFMQQKKYVKDTVGIHNIKQRDGETIEEFMKRFKIETRSIKGTEGPLVIEAEIGGHAVHRIYVDGDSSMKWGNYMAARTVKALGNYRKHRALYKSMNELYNSEVIAPYNGIIGSPGIREIQAVPSTAHRMLKFLVNGRIVTIRSTILTPTEYATIAATPKDSTKKTESHHKKFKVAVHPDFLDQEITIGGTVSTKARTELCTLLKGNLDIFAWNPSNMMGVPRSIAEYRLNIREGYSPVKQGQTPKRAKAIHVKIAEQDEKKMAFHTGHGVYCYTKIPFGLKNAGATYQRLVDKAFEKQIDRNLEIYMDDFVIKSHTRIEMQRDIEEMFHTLRKINMSLTAINTSVKRQILADFLVEKPNDAPPEASMIETPQELQGHAVWVLLANHASGRTGYDTQMYRSPDTLPSPWKVKFLIVAMDYFTKWIEAKAVATITGSQVKKFVWDNIVCHFGNPREIVSDNERENRSLGEGIKARLGEGNKNWLEELPHVLWTHRTMIKLSNYDTLFSLTYGTEAVIPLEIRMLTYRTTVVDAVHNDKELRLNLDLLKERRERGVICEAKAKLKMTKYYNARVRGNLLQSGNDLIRKWKHWEMEHTS